MTGWRVPDLRSPESIASALVGLLAVVLLATQVLAGRGEPAARVQLSSPSGMPSTSPTMDPEIRRALGTALAVNQSLASRALALESAIAVAVPLAADIAGHLRLVNTDLTAGNEAADRLLLADQTAKLGRDLGAFYDAVMARSAETLGNSIRNAEAYANGARAVIDLLTPLPAFDGRISDALARRSGAGATPSPAAPAASPSPPAPTPSQPTLPPAAPTVPPSASPPPSGVPASLVFNPGFEDGVNGWQLELTGGSQATLTHEPRGGPDGSAAARVDIGIGSLARSGISLTSQVLALGQGGNYVVELSAKSEAAREVRVRLVAGGGQITTSRVLHVGTTWSVIRFDVTHLAADPNVQLALDLGRSDATVWFDNIVIRETPG
jgi:hypothetical protein